MNRVLVTGASGFVGTHLVDLLLANGVEVWGTARRRGPHLLSSMNPNVNWCEMELLDLEGIKDVLRRSQPDCVIHLAGQSNVRKAWDEKANTFEFNVIGTINLLEAVRDVAPQARVVTIGSSEEYGVVQNPDTPIREDVLPNPLSPYGISKLNVSLLAKLYANTYGVHVIHARPFNHIGPKQSIGFVTTDIAKQIVSIERGLQENPIGVGNLEAKRDFTDVRDIVRAYWELAQKGTIGDTYNVCSSKGVEISHIVYELAKRSLEDIQIVPDLNKFRPVDVPIYVGDNSKLLRDTSWQPLIDLEQTLDDIIEDWRIRLGQPEEM